MGAPKLGQEDIRDVFGVGQKVLVRSGTEWHTREILGITVLRHHVDCPHCRIPLLGEPRFWFNDYGNVSLDEIMAKEDIDPPLLKESSKTIRASLWPTVKEEIRDGKGK